MFTRRSVPVGLLVLIVARVVSGAMGQSVSVPPPPPPPRYLRGENLAALAHDSSLENWITDTLSLGTGFDFQAMNPSSASYEPIPEGVVTFDVLAANPSWGNGAGNLARFSFSDPRRVWGVKVNTCTFTGWLQDGETGYAADTLPDAFPAYLTRTLGVVGSPGADLVEFIGTPRQGPTCDSMAVITGTPGTSYGLGLEITGPLFAPILWVNRAGSRANPQQPFGGLDTYALNITPQSVGLTALDSLDGTDSDRLHPVVLAEWCAEAWTSECQLLVGRPAATEWGVSAFRTVTTTISFIGGVQIPGTSELGRCVADAGDLNGDFVSDIWACAYDRLYAFCGQSLLNAAGGTLGAGAIIHEIHAPTPDTGFAESILAGFDYNGDYVKDVLVSAPHTAPYGRQDAGSAYIFDGATGVLLRAFHGPNAGDQLGEGQNPYLLLGGIGPPDNIPSFGIVSPGHSPGPGLPPYITDTVPTGDLLMIFSRDPAPRRTFLARLDPSRLLGSRLYADR